MTLSQPLPANAPRHLEIRRFMEEQIVSGRWPLGYKLSAEPLLAEQFGCARMTVSRAISALVDAGFLVRRRRAGTVVSRPPAAEAVLEVRDIAAEIRAQGQRHDFDRRFQRRRPATASDARRLLVGEGEPIIAVRGLHRADGAPIALEERLINLGAIPKAAEQSFAHTAPGSWLLEEIPWTEAEHQIAAVNADEADAAYLGLEIGAACLRIERRTWLAATPVTWVRLTYPGDKHRLSARFRARAEVHNLVD